MKRLFQATFEHSRLHEFWVAKEESYNKTIQDTEKDVSGSIINRVGELHFVGIEWRNDAFSQGLLAGQLEIARHKRDKWLLSFNSYVYVSRANLLADIQLEIHRWSCQRLVLRWGGKCPHWVTETGTPEESPCEGSCWRCIDPILQNGQIQICLREGRERTDAAPKQKNMQFTAMTHTCIQWYPL